MSVIHEPLKRHKWTRAEYDRMIDAGVLPPDARLELLDGEIIEMVPQKSRHAAAIGLVEQALRPIFGPDYWIRVQSPLALDNASEPEPDLAVVKGSPRDFVATHPSTAILVVEVSESTLPYDRGPKLAAYARNGIPEYWIVNLEESVVEVHRQPGPDGYAKIAVLNAGKKLEVSGQTIAIADLLP